MNICDVIRTKRIGERLSDEQIDFFIRGVTDGSWADYQISALLMAIAVNGCDERETLTLTSCMADSGDKLNLDGIKDSCDKHSTGGVGDKTTLITAPIAAACGLKVAKISGRGLGHTGGTVDKLGAVEGVRLKLGCEEFLRIVRQEGLCITEQTATLSPADKKMYALRDVTATVDSLPLIVSSVMSKKMAAGAKNIVLDVKCGDGAFMKDFESAKKLARSMVDIGKAAGRNTAALITDMDAPLGRKIGNALEVEEALEVLAGGARDELYEVSVSLAAMLLRLSGAGTKELCRARAEAAVESGAAAERFAAMLHAQGAPLPLKIHPRSRRVREFKASRAGFITGLRAETVGRACLELGAGRRKKEDGIDYGAGIELLKRPGDRVSAGDAVALLYASDDQKTAAAAALMRQALLIGERAEKRRGPVLAEIE